MSEVSLTAALDDAVRSVRAKSDVTPAIGVVLGSGLGAFGDSLDRASAIPYAEIPHMPRSTVVGHAGNLCFGAPAASPSPVFRGAFNLRRTRARARRLRRAAPRAARLRAVLLTNAAGGIDPAIEARRPDARHRSPEPHGQEPAHRPERRRARPALPRHDRAPTIATPLRRRTTSGDGGRAHAARGRLRGAPRADLRDARGDPDAAHARRERGGDEHGAGDDRAPPSTRPGRRDLVHHQPRRRASRRPSSITPRSRRRRGDARHVRRPALGLGALAARGGS